MKQHCLVLGVPESIYVSEESKKEFEEGKVGSDLSKLIQELLKSWKSDNDDS
jgi:hypothetical protein